MNSFSGLTTRATRRIRWILVVQLIWLVLALALMSWWGWLLLTKNQEMLNLHQALGYSMDSLHREGIRTQRMLFWEGLSFLGLLTSVGAFLFVLYWRDSIRQRGIQSFFASMSHELRTPLTSIRLQAESIQDQLGTQAESPKRDQLVRLTQRLLEDSQRLEAQVERTLELARLEGGGPIYTQSLNLGPWLDRTLESAREAYGNRISLEQVQGKISGQVEADATSLQVVLRNVIENSVRHSRAEPVRIEISVQESGSRFATVTIRDHGSPQKAEANSRPARLGEIFQKGAGSSGAGVGLYLVRSLVERMGGTAQFIPADDGFCVVLQLPLAREFK